MVKIGFIVEGDVEKIILNSERFQTFTKDNNLEITGIINAGGKGNITTFNQKNVNSKVDVLKDRLTQYIIFVTDLEDDLCITFTKDSIYKYDDTKQIELISVKAIESWFLADSKTLSKIFKSNFYFSNPEATDGKPFDQIKKEFIDRTGRGVSKKILAKKMIRNGFSIQSAAKHSECKSAKYFIEKLVKLSRQ